MRAARTTWHGVLYTLKVFDDSGVGGDTIRLHTLGVSVDGKMYLN